VAPAHAGADRVPHRVKQVNIKIAAKEEESGITGDSNTLGGGIPRYIVGVRTRFFQATVEEHSWDEYRGTINVSNLNCAVTQKQFWRLSGVVASKLELEALSEAAGPYAEGVGDVDVPAAGGAVTSYGERTGHTVSLRHLRMQVAWPATPSTPERTPWHKPLLYSSSSLSQSACLRGV